MLVFSVWMIVYEWLLFCTTSVSDNFFLRLLIFVSVCIHHLGFLYVYVFFLVLSRPKCTLYNVCAVPWGVFSTVGDIMSTVGRYLEYRGGYHDKCGDILSTVGVFSTMGDIMSTVGGYLEYRGVFSNVGDIMMHVRGYHEYHGGVSTVGGYHPLKFEYRGGISWYMWGDIISTVGYSNNKRFSLHGTEHPTALMISPTCIMISPTVLNTPTILKITPPWYSWYPSTVLNTPQYSRYPPTVLTISPMVLNNPHGTAHTLYRVKWSRLVTADV